VFGSRLLVAGLLVALTFPLVSGPSAVAASLATPTGPAAPDTTVGSAGTAVETDTASGPRIVAAVPNPVAPEDAGEFVVLDVPASSEGRSLQLIDDDTTVTIANVSAGRVAVTDAPARLRNRTETRVRGTASLSLANSGEQLRLSWTNGTVADSRRYEDAPEGERATWNGDAATPTWRPVGATDRPVITADGGRARAFVLPDGAGVVNETLAGAKERLLLAGYTLTSRRVADRLLAAHRRGANVSVLLDGDPVGGISRRQAAILNDLVAAGIEVRLLTGEAARYDYHHPKYAVVDDRALVSTENFKPAGTGGNSSRGWGVVVNRSAVVTGLAETFVADSTARDAKSWESVREGRTFESAPATDGTYPARFPAETVAVERTRLLVAPDNARPAIIESIDDAEKSLRVVQMAIDDRDGPFVTAAIRAARRGVDVRILLSSAWYVREDNRRTVEWLTGIADSEDLPLEAKLADPNGRYGKIHAKGLIVDSRTVVLGSLNWNREATTNNREVLVEMRGEAVGAYYAAVFDADWQGGKRDLPTGLLAAAVGCVLLAVLIGRRIEFES